MESLPQSASADLEERILKLEARAMANERINHILSIVLVSMDDTIGDGVLRKTVLKSLKATIEIVDTQPAPDAPTARWLGYAREVFEDEAAFMANPAPSSEPPPMKPPKFTVVQGGKGE